MNHLSLSLSNSLKSPLAYFFLFCSISGENGHNDVQFLTTGAPDAEAF